PKMNPAAPAVLASASSLGADAFGAEVLTLPAAGAEPAGVPAAPVEAEAPVALDAGEPLARGAFAPDVLDGDPLDEGDCSPCGGRRFPRGASRIRNLRAGRGSAARARARAAPASRRCETVPAAESGGARGTQGMLRPAVERASVWRSERHVLARGADARSVI